MKIGPEVRTTVEQRLQDGTKTPLKSGKFESVVQAQQQKLQREHLSTLLNKIDQQGNRLLKSQTLSDLREYKRLVKRFMKETVEFGMNLKKSNNWNGNGQFETMHLVERVDDELIALTDQLVSREGKSIDILGRIGEIKGLLVNLYT
ncbi:YaaR family protein [Pseudalkalibacillus berkeleyi]|uniref:YaaR family protein n=1 Tax=Pseudalkalibacillus berkeleyi TaxID=1069813 RepID=A0ABS9H3U6_9BACL|nr:YaaR family protein [Pseudalkalibacillus berkeleyi]MCF6139569.1 YaaR family protein [Pseudalkalibacillus berkeleyi]